MDLEFQESDIIFSSSDHTAREVDNTRCTAESHTSFTNSRGKSKKPLSKKKKVVQTVPVDIPCNFFHHQKRDIITSGNRKNTVFYDYDDYLDDDEEMVPPHVIVGRRIVGKIAFSVCTGIGRTLKGRDLSEVRNSVLRLTGFLES